MIKWKIVLFLYPIDEYCMKNILIIPLLLLTFVVFAQQDPYYTHFRYNQQAYNPAAAGLNKGKICLSGISHHQWRGYSDQTASRVESSTQQPGEEVKNVAPVTYNLNIATRISPIPDNKKHSIGVGATLISDKAGYRASTMFNLQLNYKIELAGIGAEFAVGPSLGFNQYGFNKTNFISRDKVDPYIPPGGTTVNDTKFDLGFGAFFDQKSTSRSIKRLFAGLSATRLTQPTFDLQWSGGGVKEQSVMHFYTVVGADVELNSAMLLEPTMLVKAGTFKPQIDLNTTLLYNDMIRGGLGYRQWGTSDAISLLFGYRNTPLRLELGYSYDITLSKLQSVSNGTHEIMVRYCIPINVSNEKTKIIPLTPRFL